ncbi:hypothetical protein N7508_001676 [Penicillium antarcticum]|uniref:uncharacterized protein n=1 Tax=Penicillium antarcticum TaxID=416450 RepID=UPI002382B69C|nr:uncharacterized protein N7508_001676 [Penicillium antarcticum]KAJ5317168.1 hypothetical protein N7508_001676 [Penicillium antarcticum]
MSNVDEDVGHTVVHFLYTGGYETVSSPLDEGTSDLAREYKRSALVYHASRNWGLTGLETLAQQKMQHLDEEVPVLEILRVMRDVFSSLPAGETWLPGYIHGNLQRLLKPEDPELGLREFYNILGQDHQFDNAVMKMILEILSIRLFSMNDQYVKIPNGIISNNSPLQGPVLEEPEPVPEDPEPVSEEPEPVPEDPEPVSEDPEPVLEDPEPVSEDPEPVPEEPEPVLEDPESVPEELPAEKDSEQWTISRVPDDADGWSRASLLPRDTPNAEKFQEAPDQGHIARISCSDLTLYEKWERLSSKTRAKRASKLVSRGLPVPSETGFISIVAT